MEQASLLSNLKLQFLLKRRSELAKKHVRDETVVTLEVLPVSATPLLLRRDADGVDVVGIGLRLRRRLRHLEKEAVFKSKISANFCPKMWGS